MFGFQRTGDQMWALGDQMGRGFLLGATAGRTTLNGEGLQHQDGHSLLLAQTNPACVAYDAAFAYELSYITQDALDRMYGERDEPVFYYLTVYNEPFPQPAQPEDLDVDGLLKGLYRYRPATKLDKAPSAEAVPAQLIASGSAMISAQRAQEMLAEEWDVAADLWSATSWNELAREAVAREAENLLSPEEPREPYVTQVLTDTQGPVVAVSDFQRAVPDQIARWVPADWSSLGTDGFGCSDTRTALRRHFHIDAPSIVVATLQSLARRGDIPADRVKDALAHYQLADDHVVDAGSAAEDDSQPVSD
jgi:pyruvate dehydrogenase E1 component